LPRRADGGADFLSGPSDEVAKKGRKHFFFEKRSKKLLDVKK
jgi:hypothetical protein